MCVVLEVILPGFLDYGQWTSLRGTAVSTQVLASKLWLRGLVVPELSGSGEGRKAIQSFE